MTDASSHDSNPIATLIVDDDFRVAQLHGAFVERVTGFVVCGYAYSGAHALRSLEETKPDLVLLDLYLPDMDGLSLLRTMRHVPPPRPDVIVISAARDAASVREAMKFGAVHYLTKPFDARGLTERLVAYRLMRQEFDSYDEVDQAQIDRLWSVLRSSPDETLPKGHSPHTMELIVSTLKAVNETLTADEIARRTGLSRSTVQRYLAYLSKLGRVDLTMRYGTTGRPEHLYSWQ